MVKQGLGIAQMPCALCEPDPEFYRISAKYTEPGYGLWLLSHVDLRTTARVRIFKNFLLSYQYYFLAYVNERVISRRIELRLRE